ncbi:CAF17-like 4Fe-4S cluster assembly/insertion protein YgfZ [Candidatus Atelocyanobacterium thalassae]|uniref:Aminomethyltransferase n=1 Tax=cyanobacterium endosymbiont of Braarudosphaera bigelowii TaxID=1285375 RepID=A0ABM7U3K0_9CHRO|nr:folate-binding protein [Candidatus Atelocyanobacterium thalassa]BDA39258.1 aminomethyltransferase [cyanobacterium endosymbiont of Braarudosphaera bigelowii]
MLQKLDSSQKDFNNEYYVFQEAYSNAIVIDMSHWGLLKITGEDRLKFLHNLSTNNIKDLKPKQLCETIFINSIGRTLDLATAYIMENEILLLVSPNRRSLLLDWMERYIFPMDKVQLVDISHENAVFSLVGPQVAQKLQKWNCDFKNISNSRLDVYSILNIKNNRIIVALNNGLALPGCTIITSKNYAKTILKELIGCNFLPASNNVWEKLRIRQGRPFPNNELTETYNPLEAGLWSKISFEKGCYIGQETIARLNTYHGVKQYLWGIKLSQLINVPNPIYVNGDKVGVLTSCIQINKDFWGLAYIKAKIGKANLHVSVNNTRGELFRVPFLTHEYYRNNKNHS